VKRIRDFGFWILDFGFAENRVCARHQPGVSLSPGLSNPKSKIQNPKYTGWGRCLAVTTSSVLILLSVGLSCSSPSGATTQPSTAYERQQNALKDPYGYSPGFEKTDISGGDLGTFDKDAFKKDVDRVFNP
jgi:hypothetical protein